MNNHCSYLFQLNQFKSAVQLQLSILEPRTKVAVTPEVTPSKIDCTGSTRSCSLALEHYEEGMPGPQAIDSSAIFYSKCSIAKRHDVIQQHSFDINTLVNFKDDVGKW
jgi:hypothetical protein